MAEQQRKEKLALEKLKEDELIEWFNSLYDQETFEVEKFGKTLKFQKYYSVATLTKIKDLEKTVQIKYLIQHMSIEPKITLKAVERMDSDLLTRISLKIKEFNEKKSGKEPSPSK